jgi:hypothetical protein
MSVIYYNYGNTYSLVGHMQHLTSISRRFGKLAGLNSIKKRSHPTILSFGLEYIFQLASRRPESGRGIHLVEIEHVQGDFRERRNRVRWGKINGLWRFILDWVSTATGVRCCRPTWWLRSGDLTVMQRRFEQTSNILWLDALKFGHKILTSVNLGP